jgi:spoIIIJ-associated protein
VTTTPIETVSREIESFLRELLSILEEEEVAFAVEGDPMEELYVNLTGNLFSIPEERPIVTALEHLMQLAVHRKTGIDCAIVLDVNGAVKKRRAELIKFALGAAESVRREHKRIRLNPMPSRERRTIHITLTNFPGVKTYSVGEGDERRVVLEPEDA